MNAPSVPRGASAAPRRAPEAHLRAEVATFPLTADHAFRAALVRLDPALTAGGATAALWRACEAAAVTHTGWSLDRLVAVRDRTWFDAEAQSEGRAQRPITMLRYLRQLARDHFLPQSGVTRLRSDDAVTAADLASRYRWLVFAMPEDLLLAAVDAPSAPVRVEVEPPLLVRGLIDRGVAEIHQHVGASMDFPLLWTSALEAILSRDVGADALAGPGAPLGEGRDLVQWLLVAAIVRVALAEHLISSQSHDRSKGCLSLFAGHMSRNRAWTSERRGAFRDCLEALRTGGSAPSPRLPGMEALRDLYGALHPVASSAMEPPSSLAEVHRRSDPIAARLGLSGAGAGERWFVTSALAHLAREPLEDPLFEVLFWQVQRVRCLVYRAVVERPLTAGLQWFVRFYNRIEKLRAPIAAFGVETAFSIAAPGQAIRAMELRTSASGSATLVAKSLLHFVRSYRDVLGTRAGASDPPEIGVVYHFNKSRDPGRTWAAGAPPAYWAGTRADPQTSGANRHFAPEGRYTSYFLEQARVARAVASLLWDVPSALKLLRGVDVASDELAIPTWVTVPLFRHLASVSAAVSPVAGAPPLGVTAHVGEDFRHLLEGMRRIDEHLAYASAGAPGRLGHAVALGMSPEAWATSVGSVLMPAEERLWDLVWEWRVYSRHHIRPELFCAPPPTRVDDLQEAIRELSKLVFDRPFEPPVIADAHHVLHRFLLPSRSYAGALDEGVDFLRRALDRWPASTIDPATRELLELHLFDEATFRKGQSLVHVGLDQGEVAALDALQRALRRAVADMGVVVEVNPSSNLLIGDMLDLRHHPVLRLSPPEREEGAPPPVAIALGSDDPLTFCTKLVLEYALLYDAARSAGYGERAVLDWLDEVRQTSLDARFTIPFRPDADRVARELEEELEHYLCLPSMSVRRPDRTRAIRPVTA